MLRAGPAAAGLRLFTARRRARRRIRWRLGASSCAGVLANDRGRPQIAALLAPPHSGVLAPLPLDAANNEARDALSKFASLDCRAEPIQASSGFHLCIWPQAGQRNGTATLGRLLSRTHSVLRPVGTGAPVRGH